MQNRIQELTEKITELSLTVKKLEAEQSTDAVQKLLAVERELSANRAVLTRLQTSLRNAQEAQEKIDAEEREKIAVKRLEELRAEYEQHSEQLRQAVKKLHAEFYRVARIQTEIAPKMQGLRYEFQRVSGDYKQCPLVFGYPSDSSYTALVNLALSASDKQIGLIMATLNAPQANFDDLFDAEKRAYTQPPKPVAVMTHDNLFSRSRRGT